MRRITLALAMAMTGGALLAGHERNARACGGCFHPPTENVSDITDERMMLAVSQQQTTLYDQIRYSGSPTSFAWVLPIHGTVDVGLSADVMFDSIDTLTATQIQQPAPACPAPPQECLNKSGSSDAGASFAPGAGGGSDGVTVTKAENVGPYETVQLRDGSLPQYGGNTYGAARLGNDVCMIKEPFHCGLDLSLAHRQYVVDQRLHVREREVAGTNRQQAISDARRLRQRDRVPCRT